MAIRMSSEIAYDYMRQKHTLSNASRSRHLQQKHFSILLVLRLKSSGLKSFCHFEIRIYYAN